MTTGEVSGAEAAVAASAADGAAPAGAAAQSAAATPAQDRSGAIVPALELGCATLSFGQPAGLPLPRLVVHARKRPIEDADVTAALAFIAAVLERREWFTILYDLRESSVPSRAQLKVGLAWAGEFTPQLDANLCGIGIVLTSRVVRSVVKFVLHVCKPPVPQCVCSEQDTALSFARECAGPPAKPGSGSATSPSIGLGEQVERAERERARKASVDDWLGWSAKQGRIVTGGGPHVAERLFSAENGYPFEEDELPHHHMIAGTSREAYGGWRQERAPGGSSVAPPNWMSGTWGRTIFTGGWEHTTDETETCYNLQTPSLFVDMRIPNERARVFSGRQWSDEPLRDLDELELRLLARQHAFGGYSRFAELQLPPATASAAHGDAESAPVLVCTRHHVADWNFVNTPRSRPNKWRVELVGNAVCPRSYHTWKEWAYAADADGRPYYLEQWVRRDPACSDRRAQTDGADADRVFALFSGAACVPSSLGSSGSLQPAARRAAVVVAVADRFSYIVARDFSGVSAAAAAMLSEWGGPLVELVDAALASGHRDLAEACLGLEAGHGSISQGWVIETSVQPWREGSSLHDLLGPAQQAAPSTLGDAPVRDAVQWGESRFDVIECDGCSGEELSALLSHRA